MAEEKLTEGLDTGGYGSLVKGKMGKILSEREKEDIDFLKDYNKKKLELSDKEAKISKEYATKSGELYEKPEFQLKSVDAFTPNQESAADLGMLFALTNVLAFTSGGKSRYSGTMALNSMSGAIEGYRKGRKDLFEREMKEFEKNIKATIENNNVIKQRLQTAQAKLAVDRDAAISDLKVLGAELEGTKLGFDIKNGRFNEAWKAIQHQDDVTAKMAQVTAQREYNMLMKIGTGGARANIYMATGKFVPDTKDATAIGDAAGAIAEVRRLREKLKDPEVQTGVASQFAPALQRLSSLGQVDETTLRNALDRELTGNDKTTLFIKDSIMAAFKIEQGLVGARVPVQTQKIVGPILDPRYYSKKTFDELLVQRENTLFENEKTKHGMTRDDMNKLAGTDVFQGDAPIPTGVKAQERFEVNKVYTDEQGNKAKYLGNGQWQEIR